MAAFLRRLRGVFTESPPDPLLGVPWTCGSKVNRPLCRSHLFPSLLFCSGVTLEDMSSCQDQEGEGGSIPLDIDHVHLLLQGQSPSVSVSIYANLRLPTVWAGGL